MQKELQNRLNFLYYYRSFKNPKNQPYEATHLSRHISCSPHLLYTRIYPYTILNWIYLYSDQADHITQAVITDYCDQRDGCHSDIRIWQDAG